MHMLKYGAPLVLLLGVAAASAQSRVHRCRDADGQWVFQGQPCRDGLTDARETQEERAQPTAPGRERLPVPDQCEEVLPKFMLADPALDGAELNLLVRRDGNGYQVLMRLAGVVEREDGPVPAQFSERLSSQGLRFDDGELISPDFRRGDRELGFGYARSAVLLDRASKSALLEAAVEPRGYAQSLQTAPLAGSQLGNVRADLLRCHQLRERARKALEGEGGQQSGGAGTNAEAQR